MKNIILFITTILILNSCTKDNEIIAIPSSPTNLISLKVTSDEVILNWTDNSTNESGYQIERKSGSGSYINVGKTGVNTTTFSDNGLTPVTTYTYRVYAYNKAGSSLQYSNEVSVTLLANLPDSLTHLTIGNSFNKSIDNLPKNLVYLNLGYYFQKSVDNLPKKLNYLIIGDSFNQSVDNLPNSLLYLSLGDSFSKSINKLPHNLITLCVGPKFDGSTNTLCNSVKTFVINKHNKKLKKKLIT